MSLIDVSKVSLCAGLKLVESFQRHGYAYVSHPTLTPSLISEVKSAAHTLCRAPDDVRTLLGTPCGFRGYYTYVGASGPSDRIVCFSVGKEGAPNDVRALRAAYYRAIHWHAFDVLMSNQWWDDPRALAAKGAMLHYYDICSKTLVPTLLDSIALGMSRAHDIAAEKLWVDGDESKGSVLRYLHSNEDHNLEAKLYPAHVSQLRGNAATRSPASRVLRGSLPTNVNQKKVSDCSSVETPIERLKTHKDLSSVTLLMQDTMGGLEVLDADTESFVEVPVLEDALLVNAGAFLEHWSGNALSATPHRVRNRMADARGSDRCSIVFFAFPNFDAVLSPVLGSSHPVVCGDLHPLPV